MSLVEKAKRYFHQKIADYGSDPYLLAPHIPEMEKWAKYVMKRHPADEEVVLLAVNLHDIGHYPILSNIDHAIRGEGIAKRFLKRNGYEQEKTDKVLHCIRAHRCHDVMPETIEAKIIAFSDSASHMTDVTYTDMVRVNEYTAIAFEKLERDYRDLHWFPEIKKELKGLYEAWKTILNACRSDPMFLEE